MVVSAPRELSLPRFAAGLTLTAAPVKSFPESDINDRLSFEHLAHL